MTCNEFTTDDSYNVIWIYWTIIFTAFDLNTEIKGNSCILFLNEGVQYNLQKCTTVYFILDFTNNNYEIKNCQFSKILLLWLLSSHDEKTCHIILSYMWCSNKPHWIFPISSSCFIYFILYIYIPEVHKMTLGCDMELVKIFIQYFIVNWLVTKCYDKLKIFRLLVLCKMYQLLVSLLEIMQLFCACPTLKSRE